MVKDLKMLISSSSLSKRTYPRAKTTFKLIAWNYWASQQEELAIHASCNGI